ncbi:hypothetical protein AURDEDRAFT_172748, partial [Auricularia subglabra TFB-10046 SS5]
MLPLEAPHPWIVMSPEPDVDDDDDGPDAPADCVATTPSPAALQFQKAVYLRATGPVHNADMDGDGSEGEDDLGWPSASIAVDSLMALAQNPRLYQRAAIDVEPRAVLPPRGRKRPIEAVEDLSDLTPSPSPPPPQK